MTDDERAPQDEKFDVVIAGARCAGSPLGMLLARKGFRVAILEKAVFPKDTLSSHVMQTDALTFLSKAGLLDRIRDTGATFMRRVDARIDDYRFAVDYPLRAGDVGGAASIRRHVLDPILADAAAEAGAQVRMATKVTGLVEEDGRVVGVQCTHGGVTRTLRADLVVGADGRSSTVARLAGSREYNVTENERWYYWTYFEGADLGDVPSFVFHRWADRFVFGGPTDHGLYIVGVSPETGERERFREDLHGWVLDHAMSCEPVAKALANARRATKVYGISRFSNYFRHAHGPGWVLVGDAGHFKDPAIGRGIGDAFLQVERLAEAIETGLPSSRAVLDRELARWAKWRDRKFRGHYWLAGDIGKAGPLPVILSEATELVHRSGDINRFMELFSHRARPTEVLTVPRVLDATRRMLLRRGQNRRVVLRDAVGLLVNEIRRRWRNVRPLYARTAGEVERLTPRVRKEVPDQGAGRAS